MDKVLVAGIGNIFLGDDGFGVEVANRLSTKSLPASVRVSDFGIRGVHLAYELLEGYDALILVDAVPMGEPPGTIAVIEPDSGERLLEGDGAAIVDAHSMSPTVVLHTLAHLGGSLDRIFVVGCQPASLEEGIGLSQPVAEAVDRAADMCCELANEILLPAGKGTTG